MRLNLGAGQFPLEGYTNVDLAPPADVVGDFTAMDFAGVTEIVMTHCLEHLPHPCGPAVLRRLRAWLVPGGLVTIEVPDMAAICAAPESPTFQRDAYGCQISAGEYHLAGYTLGTLATLVRAAGFEVHTQRAFASTHPARRGMPCVEVVAVAP